jgi:two-component system chemotaxis response regulator CheY
LFRDRELRVDLLLLDLMLPNASGLTVIRKLREAKTPRRKNLPVIVITGRTDTETYKMATRRGIHGYLLKPLSAALLNETVNGVLAAHGHKPPKPLDTLAATSPPPGRDLPPSLDDKF